MAAQLSPTVGRDAATIRDSWLRTVRSAMIQRGTANPDVTPDSELYIRGQAFGNELAVIEANGDIVPDQLMPDTAQGDNLLRICAVFGLSLKVATGSVGPVVAAASAPITVNLNDKLVDGAGLTYQTTVAGVFNDGDSIAIEAVSTGAGTNHAAGDVLRWVSTPAFAAETVTVGAGGLINGLDAEDPEALRARLFAVLQSPPASGNAQHVAMFTEDSTPVVQKAFVYPAIDGPSSVHIAVAAAPSTTTRSRVVASPIMTGTVIPYVDGQVAVGVDVTTTATNDVPTDVAFALALPEAPTASPPGAGGGWLNGTVWPAPDGISTFRCTVTGVTSATQFTVDEQTAPTPLVTQICWVDLSATPKLYTATVIAVSGTAGAYTITLDQPFANIAVGNYIWPACQNAQAYVDAVLGAYALMGPGEKSSNTSALIRGFRHPRPAASWPMTLGGHLTQAITKAQPEVESATFFHRTDGTTTVTGMGLPVYPQVPGSLAAAPNIFTPRNIAFYRVPS